jgi:phage host-nuclease inhibitor protein Gam
VNWTPLGFFTEKHPKFVNHEAIRQDIVQKFASGWNNDRMYWTADKKKEIQHQLNTKVALFDPTDFPFLVTSMTTTTKDTKDRSYTVSIIVPHKFSRAGRMIMDYLLLKAKVLPNYVPIAFKYEDPIAFGNILKAHDLWMDNHRNIQINNIPDADYLTDHPAVDGTTLIALLTANPNILDFNFDPKHSRLNVSVDRKNFATISNTLSEQINAATFPFHPMVRRVTTYSSNNSQGSATTAASKYSEILSGMISSATSQTSYNQQSASTNRRNAWSKNVPSTIDFYGNTSAHFPPLRPSSPITDNQSHETASIGITASTLQSAIQEALAEVQRKHNAEIQSMKEEMSALREQLAQRDNSDSNRLEKKIDLLMHHLDLGTGRHPSTPDDPTPSPFRKKPRNERSDAPDPTGPKSSTDDSGWGFDDDDDVTSSQDGAEALSGSEE